MKIQLLAALALSSTSSAQVIECPEYLPSKQVQLSDAASARKASARVLPSRLSFAGIQVSELYGDPVEVPPGSKKVKGGWETEYRFTPEETKWLVCAYGGNEWDPGKKMIGGKVEWWGKVDQKSTSCVLKVREAKEWPYPTRWTATATCK